MQTTELDLTGLTADIVSAYVAHNALTGDKLPDLIGSVRAYPVNADTHYIWRGPRARYNGRDRRESDAPGFVRQGRLAAICRHWRSFHLISAPTKPLIRRGSAFGANLCAHPSDAYALFDVAQICPHI